MGLDDADDEDDADEEALADVELLADETGLDDDGEVLGDDVGLVVLCGFGLVVVPGTVGGCSTVLGVGLDVAASLVETDGDTAEELMCCTVLLPTSPLVWPWI